MRAVFVILLTLSLSACDEVYRYVKTGDVGWALKNALRDKKAHVLNWRCSPHFSGMSFSCLDPINQRMAFAGAWT